MKKRPPAILVCPNEKCGTAFLSDAVFYVACNCGPPLACKHNGVALAIYQTQCPTCKAPVDDHEHLDMPNGRQE